MDLESLDDMKLLEEFAEELGASDEEIKATIVPEEEIDGMTEEEKLMFGETENSEEEKVFEKLSNKSKQKTKTNKTESDQEIDEVADDETIDIEGELDENETDGLGLDAIGGLEEDYDLLAPEDRPEAVQKAAKKKSDQKVYETLAEKQQRERNLVDELNAVKEKELEKLINKKIQEKSVRWTPTQILALQTQLKDILKSPTQYGNIRKGTLVISLKDDKMYKLNRDITVLSHTQPDAGNFRYIVNKKGEVTYKVYFNKVANITRITDLYQKPHYFTRLKRVKKVDNNDKKLDYSFKFNLHGGLTFNQYTNQIVGGTENYAPMLRTEFAVVTKLNYPFHVGMAAMYESIKGNIKRGGTFSTKILSFGPTLVVDQIYENYDLIFQPRISLFADLAEQASDGTTVHRLTDTSLLLGVEKNTKYKMFGKLTVGLNIQRKWIKPKAQNTAFDIGSDVRYDDSIAMYVGHNSDWIW